MDRFDLIDKINKIEPDNYSDWSVEQLQEFALFLGININE